MRTLRAGNSNLFFSAHSDSRQIWVSDGSTAGTLRMTDIDPSERNIWITSASNLVVNNIYFFQVRRNSDSEFELWRSNGSVAGTFKLIDLPDYLDDSYKAVGAGGLYYFVPWSTPDYGRELWVSDGSVAGTRMVKDINPGSVSSSPHNLIAVNDRLYFLVGDNVWTSDGTSGGTRAVTSFEESFYGGIRYMTSVNKMIYLGYFRSPVYELWRHNTNSGLTVLVKHFDAIAYDRQNYAAVGDMLYFIAKGTGLDSYDLWKTDGTPDGTIVVKNIAETNAGYTDWSLTNVNGTLFFRANDKEHGWELWKSNGTANETFMIKDVKEGKDSSRLYCFTAVGDTLFFAEKQTDYVTNLWMSDGTEAGTINTDVGVSQLRCPVNFNEQLYFYGGDRTTKEFGNELYRYNLSNTVLTAPEINVATNGIKVTLSWNSIGNADSYTLFFAPYPFIGPETIGSIDLGNNTRFSADLWNGAAFYIAVKAYHDDSSSEFSNVGLLRIQK